MSNSNNVETTKLIVPKQSINQKLGTNTKFDQAFDKDTIKRAENAVNKSSGLFKNETIKDFEALSAAFSKIVETPTSSDYNELSVLSFSIKSRAGTGGLPLVSQVANSMYKFCDAAAVSLPAEGYRVLKVHLDSLNQLFSNKFPNNDLEKAQRLVNGLEEVSRKYQK